MLIGSHGFHVALWARVQTQPGCNQVPSEYRLNCCSCFCQSPARNCKHPHFLRHSLGTPAQKERKSANAFAWAAVHCLLPQQPEVAPPVPEWRPCQWHLWAMPQAQRNQPNSTSILTGANICQQTKRQACLASHCMVRLKWSAIAPSRRSRNSITA